MIKTVEGMNNVLQTQNHKDWLKTSEIGTRNTLGITQRPEIPADGDQVQKTFGEFLLESINKVNNLQHEANVAIEKLATGQSNNLHETMIAVEQAELAFKSMNQIRMKVLDAYREIMKMQI